MFSRYFGDRYFPARFFPNDGAEAVVVPWISYSGTTATVGYTGAALRRDRYSGSVTVQGYGGTAEGGEE